MIDEDLRTIVVGVLLVLAGFTLFQAFFADRVVEPFSELGILGPEMKIGDYPRELMVGENFDLYLYLGNHMGSVEYYMVDVKLGSKDVNVSDAVPYDAPLIASYEAVLVDGANVTIPITLSIPTPGVNLRLVFELNRYDAEAGGFEYHERWNQLWLNVTEPR